MQSFSKNLRELLGVIAKDFLRYNYYIHSNDDKYLRLHNRLERIASGPNGIGYVCLWPHTSRLHAACVIPSLGLKLLKKCLKNSQFELREERLPDLNPKVSVILGHRGMERLPLLLTTLKSIASQIDVSLECIIVEQDSIPRIKEYLPNWVKYIFLQTQSDLAGYNRSAGFNRGAELASGEILVLHDNDMLMPTSYCKNIVHLMDNGYEAVNSKRYVFYLHEMHSQRVISSIQEVSSKPPDYIVQNLEAGGSMAITKNGYKKIGGMDEEFVGWGGEDIEFWNRCSHLKRWIWGYEPLIHLWHKNQPLKTRTDNPNIAKISNLSQQRIEDRIYRLKKTNYIGD